MKKRKVKQIFQHLLIAFVVFSLICPGSLWAKREKPGAKIIVTKEDGQTVNGELLQVEDDSLLLLIPKSLAKVLISIDEIDYIKFKRKSKAGKGATIGFFGGGAAGYAIGYYGDPELIDPGGSHFAPLRGIIFGVVGALAGLIIGSIIGDSRTGSYKYQVKWESTYKIRKILEKLKKKARFKD